MHVIHKRGLLLEETAYYPFGLTMAGISSKAANSLENNKNKFQNQELTKDFGIDIYEFKYRAHDLQTGRFWQIDPLADKYVYNSTYAFSENHVTSHVELEGLEKVPVNGENLSGDPDKLPSSLKSKNNLIAEKNNIAESKAQSEAPPKQIKHSGVSVTGVFTVGAQAQIKLDGVGVGGGIAVDAFGLRDNEGIGMGNTHKGDGTHVRKYAEVVSPPASTSMETEEIRVNSEVVQSVQTKTTSILGILDLKTQTNPQTNTTTSWLSASAGFKMSFGLGVEFGIELTLYDFGTSWIKKKN